jgi:hypothetical protein
MRGQYGASVLAFMNAQCSGTSLQKEKNERNISQEGLN